MVRVYRKKPERIEAEQLHEDNGDRVAAWCGGRYAILRDRGVDDGMKSLSIPTLAGVKQAYHGDFVVKSNGQFSSCKPDVFWATYERMGLR